MTVTIAQIQQDQLTARKEKNELAKVILTMLLSDVKNIAINERREATEKDIQTAIKRLMDKAKENIEIYTKAGNSEKVQEAQGEIAILSPYMPTMATEEEVSATIASIITEKQLEKTPKSIGAIMGGLKAKFGASLDGTMAKKLADAALK